MLLAEGANQMRSFRFNLPSGRRKAPDLVAYREGRLGIFEAKVRPGALFKRSAGAESDFDAIQCLRADEAAIDAMRVEARRRLLACGTQPHDVIEVSFGLVANGSCVECNADLAATGLVLVNVDCENGRFCFESAGWPE